MPFNFNGVDIEAVTFNGSVLDKIVYNGTTVWEAWLEYNAFKHTTAASNDWTTSGYVISRGVYWTVPADTKVKTIYIEAHVQNHVSFENATVYAQLDGYRNGAWETIAFGPTHGSGTNNQNSVTYSVITHTFPTDSLDMGYTQFRAYSKGNSFRRGVYIFLNHWFQKP